MNKVKAIFLNTDLRSQHNGLRLKAFENKIDTTKLSLGEHIIFLNRAKNKLKMFSANNVLSYLTVPRGTIDLRALSFIPDCFTGGNSNLTYTRAVKRVIDARLKSL